MRGRGSLACAAQDPVATFSILGYDPATGEVGGAVQSRVFSVGNGVLWAEAGVGAAATQAIVDVSYGPKAIELLRAGMKPEAIIKAIWDSDPDPQPERWTKEGRQFAVIDHAGQHRRLYRAEGHDLGRAQARASTARRRATSSPARRVVNGMIEAFEQTHGPSVGAPHRGARGRAEGRRRQARHAVGRDSDRRQGPGRVAQQRRRDAPAGGRQPGADQGAAAARGFVERAPARRASSGR